MSTPYPVQEATPWITETVQRRIQGSKWVLFEESATFGPRRGARALSGGVGGSSGTDRVWATRVPGRVQITAIIAIATNYRTVSLIEFKLSTPLGCVPRKWRKVTVTGQHGGGGIATPSAQ